MAEEVLWQALRGQRLDGARFRRQHAIERFVVDFYCAEARLVVEVDGPIHAQQVEQDRARQSELEERGLTVIRFSNDEVLDNEASVLARIAVHLTPNPSPKSERGARMRNAGVDHV